MGRLVERLGGRTGKLVQAVQGEFMMIAGAFAFSASILPVWVRVGWKDCVGRSGWRQESLTHLGMRPC